MSFFQQYYNKTPGTLRKDKTPGTLKNVKQQLGTLKNIVTGKNKVITTGKNKVITTYVSDYKTELSYQVLDSYFKRFPVLFFMEQSAGLSKPLQHVIKSYTSIEPDKTPIEPDKTPIELDKTPIEPDKTPIELDKTPIEPDKTPIEPDKTPIELDKTPIELDKTPIELDKTPIELDKTPIELDKTPIELDKTPIEPSTTRIDYNLIKNNSEKLSAYIKNESADTELNEKTLSDLNNQLNNLNRELGELKNKCYDTCSTKYANNDETYKAELSKMKEDVAFAFANHCTSRDHNENAGKPVELHHSVPKITEPERIYLKECWEYNIIVATIEPKIGILRARLENLFKNPDVKVNEHLRTLKENADIFYNNHIQKEKPKPSAGGKSKSRRRKRTRKIKNTRR